jgi:CRISPR-associated protein Cst1
MKDYYIDIHAEDWLLTAGLIGLKRLYNEDDLELTSTGIRLYPEQLKSLPERYFNYFITTYSIANRDVERFERLLKQAIHKPEKTKDMAAEIRKTMNDQYKKVEKYFADKSECLELRDLIGLVKDCKKPENLNQLEECINQYKTIMNTPFINEKLTLNYAKAVIISPFYGQPSFLQAANNTLTKEEHIDKMYADFIQSVELELELHKVLQTANKIEDIIDFLENHDDYQPFKAWLRATKKMNTLEDVQSYFNENILPCSFIDTFPSTMSFEEMMFSPLGLSLNKAVNFYWDFNKKNPVPMSSLGRLILFMIPVGLTFYQRKLGSGRSSEYLRFGGLVMDNNSFQDNVNINQYYRGLRQTGSSFDEIVLGLLEDAKERSKRKESSLLFIELYSNYQTKKTLLDYYHMPTYVSLYLQSFGNSIKGLYLTEYRERFVRSILSGHDPKQTIFQYLREAIKFPQHALGAFIAVRERFRLTQMKKGVSSVNDVKKRDKRVSVAFYQGKELRDTIVFGRDSNGKETGPYRASGRKKIESVAYRLLNATRAGNKHAFLDTVLRLHVGAGKEVSSIFLDALKEEEGLDFETVAGAFIAGLLGEERKDNLEGAVQ